MEDTCVFFWILVRFDDSPFFVVFFGAAGGSAFLLRYSFWCILKICCHDSCRYAILFVKIQKHMSRFCLLQFLKVNLIYLMVGGSGGSADMTAADAAGAAAAKKLQRIKSSIDNINIIKK